MTDSSTSSPDTTDNTPREKQQQTRRDFMILTTTALGAIGTAAVAWPLIDSLNPSADVLALSSIEVDLSAIKVGQSITVKWRGKPIFIRRRTEKEINDAQQIDIASLPDPEHDIDRVVDDRDEYLVLVGVCTHLGCVPLGEQGEYDGWFCPCHGSHYDTSGRIRKGPAPKNLEIPPYAYLDDTTIKIG